MAETKVKIDEAITIDKTVETLTSIKTVCKGLFPPLEQKAIQLGIEALKFVKRSRREAFPLKVPLLPGETKDRLSKGG